MDTEEVDLGHHHGAGVDLHVDRDGSDGGHELASLGVADTKDPVRLLAWRSEGPLEEVDTVVKSEKRGRLVKKGEGGKGERGAHLNMASSSST